MPVNRSHCGVSVARSTSKTVPQDAFKENTPIAAGVRGPKRINRSRVVAQATACAPRSTELLVFAGTDMIGAAVKVACPSEHSVPSRGGGGGDQIRTGLDVSPALLHHVYTKNVSGIVGMDFVFGLMVSHASSNQPRPKMHDGLDYARARPVLLRHSFASSLLVL